MSAFDFYLICLSVLYTLPCYKIAVVTLNCPTQILQICIEIFVTDIHHLHCSVYFIMSCFFLFCKRIYNHTFTYKCHRNNAFYVTNNKAQERCD